jgi:hypothetical protein
MIQININKAKTIAHDMRRDARAKEFAPLDEQIMKQIPGTDAQTIEADRQAIRDKYAAIQDNINAASTVDEIKSALAAAEQQGA